MSCDLLSQLKNRGMFDKHFMEVHSLVLVAYESTLESIPYRCFALRTFNRFQFHVVLQVKPVVLVWKEQQQSKKRPPNQESRRSSTLLRNKSQSYQHGQTLQQEPVISRSCEPTGLVYCRHFSQRKTCDFPSWLSQTSTGKADKVNR